ncbi:hypothetical protein IQ270_13500 [Microcoleus sp. LEGE 07076]|nr:hypothetical protein [Microcoleus sp. LEGE 07076]
MLEVALRLLDECDRADRESINSVRVKIDAAVAVSEHTPPIDGETFMARMCDRFRQARESNWFFLTWYAKLTLKMPRTANIYFCSFQNL